MIFEPKDTAKVEKLFEGMEDPPIRSQRAGRRRSHNEKTAPRRCAGAERSRLPGRSESRLFLRCARGGKVI